MERAVVTILGGKKGEDSVEFGDYLSLGRGKGNLLQLQDAQVSRFHAEILLRQDGYWLRDLQSTGGTLVNGAPITEYKLESGVIFQIGGDRLSFEIVDPEADFAPAEDTVTRIYFSDVDVLPVGTSQIAPEMDEASPLESKLPPELIAELGHLRKRYRMLHRANRLISGELPLAAVYNDILELLFEVVPADRGVILTKNPTTDRLMVMASHTRDKRLDIKEVEMSTSILKQAREQGAAVLTRDALMDQVFDAKRSIVEQRIRSAICAPLIHKGGDTLGFIYLDTLHTLKPFDQEMLELVSAVAGPAGVAIKNAIYTERLRSKQEELQRSHLATLSVITSALEARDRYTVGHAQRVSSFGMTIADQLGWNAERKRQLEVGGMLHDMGKVGIRDSILTKPGRLSDDEFRAMRLHPDIGARILRNVPALEPVIPYALCHHERWDGNGYPQSLAGEAIPVEGRLMSVADAFDAMTSKRVYRSAVDPDVAREEIEKCSGSQFDPAMVEAFMAAWEAGAVEQVLTQTRTRESVQVLCPICSAYLGHKKEVAAGESLDCPICQRRFRISDKHQAVLETVKPEM